jgi:hypothetical protein
MYLHFVVPTGKEWKPFCGPDALAQAKDFARGEYPIWAMTRAKAVELGLLRPKTDHQFNEVSIEADVFYAPRASDRTAFF